MRLSLPGQRGKKLVVFAHRGCEGRLKPGRRVTPQAEGPWLPEWPCGGRPAADGNRHTGLLSEWETDGLSHGHLEVGAGVIKT